MGKEMAVVGLLVPLLAVFVVHLERAEAAECDGVSTTTQKACREALGLGQYPKQYVNAIPYRI